MTPTPALGMALIWLVSVQCQADNDKTDGLDPKQTISDVRHQTNLGSLIGQRVTNHFEGGTENTYYAFRKIPYAIPPTGDKRWTDPEIKETGWEGEYDARAFGPVCLQSHWPSEELVGDEDCLHLNIFIPKRVFSLDNSQPADKALFPVMIWIHGGGYQDGSASDYLPDKLMRGRDIVLVTINYRLNVFGFLSSNDRVLPGNYGHLDQVAALRWVKNHVRDFGGDPNLITIFGESAGASSVHAIVLSPLAKGLFRSAIIQSGAAICDWGITNTAMDEMRALAKSNDCLKDSDDLESTVPCLRSKPAQDLVNSYLRSREPQLLFPSFLAPVVDKSRPNPFFPDHPKVLLKNGDYSHVPMIIGITEEEGALFAGLMGSNIKVPWSKQVNDNDELKRLLMPELFEDVTHTKDEARNERNIELIHKKYFSNVGNDDEKAISAASDLLGDRMFLSCGIESIKLHKKTSKSPLYAYLFTYRNRPTLLNFAMATLQSENKTIPEKLKKAGATHFDDVFYLFKLKSEFDSCLDFEGLNITGRSKEEDIKSQDRMSKKMTNIWAAFAKTASLKDSVAENKWEPVSSDSRVKLYVLDEEDKPMFTDYRKEFVDFWESMENHSEKRDELR